MHDQAQQVSDTLEDRVGQTGRSLAEEIASEMDAAASRELMRRALAYNRLSWWEKLFKPWRNPSRYEVVSETIDEACARIQQEHEALGAWDGGSGRSLAAEAAAMGETASRALVQQVLAYNRLSWWEKVFTKPWSYFSRYGSRSRNHKLCVYLGARQYVTSRHTSAPLSLWDRRAHFLSFLKKSREGRSWGRCFRVDDECRRRHAEDAPARDLMIEYTALHLRVDRLAQRVNQARTWLEIALPCIAEVKAGRLNFHILVAVNKIAQKALDTGELARQELESIDRTHKSLPKRLGHAKISSIEEYTRALYHFTQAFSALKPRARPLSRLGCAAHTEALQAATEGVDAMAAEAGQRQQYAERVQIRDQIKREREQRAFRKLGEKIVSMVASGTFDPDRLLEMVSKLKARLLSQQDSEAADAPTAAAQIMTETGAAPDVSSAIPCHSRVVRASQSGAFALKNRFAVRAFTHRSGGVEQWEKLRKIIHPSPWYRDQKLRGRAVDTFIAPFQGKAVVINETRMGQLKFEQGREHHRIVQVAILFDNKTFQMLDKEIRHGAFACPERIIAVDFKPDYAAAGLSGELSAEKVCEFSTATGSRDEILQAVTGGLVADQRQEEEVQRRVGLCA